MNIGVRIIDVGLLIVLNLLTKIVNGEILWVAVLGQLIYRNVKH